MNDASHRALEREGFEVLEIPDDTTAGPYTLVYDRGPYHEIHVGHDDGPAPVVVRVEGARIDAYGTLNIQVALETAPSRGWFLGLEHEDETLTFGPVAMEGDHDAGAQTFQTIIDRAPDDLCLVLTVYAPDGTPSSQHQPPCVPVVDASSDTGCSTSGQAPTLWPILLCATLLLLRFRTIRPSGSTS